MAEAIEQLLLQQLADAGTVADSGEFAAGQGYEHEAVVGTIKSLQMAEMIAVEVSMGCYPGGSSTIAAALLCSHCTSHCQSSVRAARCCIVSNQRQCSCTGRLHAKGM